MPRNCKAAESDPAARTPEHLRLAAIATCDHAIPDPLHAT